MFVVTVMSPDWEECLATYNSGPNTITRTRVIRSTNGNAAVNWAAGTKEVFVDLPGASDLTAADLNAREFVHGGDTEETNTALDEAREFLWEMLKAGPMLVDELCVHAKKAGVSVKTLRRAKDKDHYKARRHPQEGLPGNKWPWEWYDPRQSTEVA